MGQILPILENIKQVKEVDKLILLFCNHILNFPKLTFLHKIFKVTKLTMANCIVLNCTNIEFLAVNIQKKQRVQCTGIQYNSQRAYILSMNNVKKKKLANSRKKGKKS